MPLKDNCDKLEPIPTPISDIADELQQLEDENTKTPENLEAAVIDVEGKDRKAERILVSRQEFRRNAYVEQLIKEGKNAIQNISSLKVDLDNYNADAYKEAIAILQGKEEDVMVKLKAALQQTMQEGPQMNKYLDYVKGLL